jgi:hypothetical protein
MSHSDPVSILRKQPKIRRACTFENGLSDSGVGCSLIFELNESCRLPPQPLAREGSSVNVQSPVASPRPHYGSSFLVGQPLPFLPDNRCLPIGPGRRFGRRVGTILVRRSATPRNVIKRYHIGRYGVVRYRIVLYRSINLQYYFKTYP